MFQLASDIFRSVAKQLIRVPEPMTGAEWADKYFVLSAESSNTSGPWKTTKPQVAILNAMTNDAIKKVDMFKSARVGGTKMLLATAAYNIVYRNRNTGFYQPTKTDAEDFSRTEVAPAIRDCEVWSDMLISDSDKSSLNTLSYKAFRGSNLYIRGGHSPNAYRRLTLDTVLLDELDAFNPNIGGEGDPTTLSWGRVKNAIFQKQCQISTPLLEGFSAIEKNANAADDTLEFHVECPHCGGHDPIHWGGPDYEYGFKFDVADPESVLHYCRLCGAGWGNALLAQSFETAYWAGESLKTYDGMKWYKLDKETGDYKSCMPPRHVAFKIWSAYSQFSPWSQIVEEFRDAKGDIEKMKAFTNTTLGRLWKVNHAGTISEQAINAMVPYAAEDMGEIVAVTAGVDTQGDRLEVTYIGHTRANGNIYVLGYDIFRGDTQDDQVWLDMGRGVLDRRFLCGEVERPVLLAAIDTQGHATTQCHKFLVQNRKRKRFIGINGSGSATFEIANISGTYKQVKGSEYWTIGVNVLKSIVYSAIRNFDKERGSFRIAEYANLPEGYASQLVVEKMEVSRSQGKDRIVFTNKDKKRNEALDVTVYALAAKAHLKENMGRQWSRLFAD